MPSEKKCVNVRDVPCPKAREYLEKHGLICGQEPPAKKPRPVPSKVRSFLKEWLD
jgi:hypothetical protein